MHGQRQTGRDHLFQTSLRSLDQLRATMKLHPELRIKLQSLRDLSTKC